MATLSNANLRTNQVAGHVQPEDPNALDFISFDPYKASGASPCKLFNFVNGAWKSTNAYVDVVDPLNGENFIKMPDTRGDAEIKPFVDTMKSIPKSGLHNPLKNPDKYQMWGDINFKLAQELDKPKVADHFARCIQRVVPKSYPQALGEVVITKHFLMNFGWDQVRMLARGFTQAGDHDGQESRGYRWPWGAVCIIAPFNFPLEIPILQLMGALMMGNHVTIKSATTTSMVVEEWLRLMFKVGAPLDCVNLIHSGGRAMGELVKHAADSQALRAMQFTGSNGVAKQLAQVTGGKVKVEDAGFNWKIMGTDVSELDFVGYWCDQDAYSNSGQKCSAQSIIFCHSNWIKAGLLDKMKSHASERKLDSLTIAPILTETTDRMLTHMNKCLAIPGAKLLFGGKELENHKIPKQYGAIQPTAVFVPLKEIVKDENWHLVETEIFGPFQIVTEWSSDADLELVLGATERMENHLTACVCSNDMTFLTKCLGRTVNGTTYCGIRGRTTGAPQNHWFGPAGDPRGAGIGSPEAIKLVWSCHREIISDHGPVPTGWKRPPPS